MNFEYTNSHWQTFNADQLTERPVLCTQCTHYNTSSCKLRVLSQTMAPFFSSELLS